jgi:hypothetical protein
LTSVTVSGSEIVAQLLLADDRHQALEPRDHAIPNAGG